MTLDERDAAVETSEPPIRTTPRSTLWRRPRSGASDEERPHPLPTPGETHILEAGALAVLRRGVAATPELRQGIFFTALMALATAAGKLAVPVLIQQILDRGATGRGFRPEFVYPACALTAAVAVVLLYLANRFTYLRLVRASENSLLGLRVRLRPHPPAVDGRAQRAASGALVARVTSDIETLAQFMEWGRWRGSSTASSSPPSP